MTGSGTIVDDDPSLDARREEAQIAASIGIKQPLRVVIVPAPQIECKPQTQVGNGGTNHAGCNTGGVGIEMPQLAMVAARARSYYDEQAKRRQRESGGDKRAVPANLPEPSKPHTDARDAAGKAVGVSGKSVAEALPCL